MNNLRMNSLFNFKAFGFMTIIIGTLQFTSCKEKIEGLDEAKIKNDEFTTVEVKNIKISNEPIPIYSIGKICTEEEVKLSFKIGGIISKIYGEEGKTVKKGETLAILRTNEIDAQVNKAQRALQKAKRDLERVQTMYNDGAATLENIQDLTTLVEISRSDLEVAQFNQSYAKIVSPVSGRILLKNAEAHELVSPGQPIYIIAAKQATSLLKASISDKDISKINYGDKAKISFDAYPEEEFDGSIIRFSESADPRTGTFEVEIQLNEKGKRLRNGYIGRVEIFPKQILSYLKIPIDALVEGVDDGVIIFTPDRNLAKRHVVVPQHIGKDYFTISNDQDFSQVITTGAPFLLDGDKIKITEAFVQ